MGDAARYVEYSEQAWLWKDNHSGITINFYSFTFKSLDWFSIVNYLYKSTLKVTVKKYNCFQATFLNLSK